MKDVSGKSTKKMELEFSCKLYKTTKVFIFKQFLSFLLNRAHTFSIGNAEIILHTIRVLARLAIHPSLSQQVCTQQNLPLLMKFVNPSHEDIKQEALILFSSLRFKFFLFRTNFDRVCSLISAYLSVLQPFQNASLHASNTQVLFNANLFSSLATVITSGNPTRTTLACQCVSFVVAQNAQIQSIFTTLPIFSQVLKAFFLESSSENTLASILNIFSYLCLSLNGINSLLQAGVVPRISVISSRNNEQVKGACFHVLLLILKNLNPEQAFLVYLDLLPCSNDAIQTSTLNALIQTLPMNNNMYSV